jgi:hypothetical protein
MSDAFTDFCCARCGSSIAFETCEHCGGSGADGHECGEDCCSCADPEDNVACGICGGDGHYGVCLSSAEWCEANPRPGREGVERSTVEEFEVS